MEQKPIAIGTQTRFIMCEEIDCSGCDFMCGYKRTMNRLWPNQT